MCPWDKSKGLENVLKPLGFRGPPWPRDQAGPSASSSKFSAYNFQVGLTTSWGEGEVESYSRQHLYLL